VPDEPGQMLLEAVNRVGRQMDSLTEAVGNLPRMVALHLGRAQTSMDRIEARIGTLEGSVRCASGQLLLANQIF